ncbi:hypothetical protein SMSP2_00776 [Limihaloglobus sulfuriphilus]|uniref:Uncharacterized protein n=1 Tax=Limihaloglobus sulfuriphilus TaxID=1851148 RepID=A0A1Q2MD08_9BACT|nr:hypothetical protein SMSP2_00776 [Limihaloglobus sulfuriphilus]
MTDKSASAVAVAINNSGITELILLQICLKTFI